MASDDDECWRVAYQCAFEGKVISGKRRRVIGKGCVLIAWDVL
jgi:hypothetical protein